MNNVQSKINKLIMALKVKGRVIKINTSQFYIEDKDKVITKYIVYETNPKDGEDIYGKVNVLKYLVKLYRELGESSG
jgi:capsular polysaccharide biosynthesis protein